MINVHPIMVHFPVALLTIYAVLELLAFKKLRQSREWFTVKLVLVVLGVGSAVVAVISGLLIEDLFEEGPIGPVVEAHQTWAFITLALFGFLALMYLINATARFSIVDADGESSGKRLYRSLHKFSVFILESPLVYIIVLGALMSITITGALGGSIGHGPDADPVVRFVYDYFVPK